MPTAANSNIAIRVAVEGGDQAKRDMQDIGTSGQQAFQKIKDASEPASVGMRALNAASGEATQVLEGFSQSAGRLGSVLADIGPGGLVAAGVLGAVALAVHHSVEEAEAFEQAQRKIAAVLQATGQAAGLTQADLTAMADSASHTTLYTSEQVQQAEAVLLTYKQIHSDVFGQALQATLDVSTLFDKDLTSSARAVGRALEDPVKGMTALQRVGVTLDPIMKENIKNLVETGQQSAAQKLILDALATSVGGQAAAQDQGLTGASHALSTSLKELSIAFGQNIEQSGVMQGLVNGLATAFSKLREEVRPTTEEELKEVTARMQLMQSAGTDSFFDGAVANPFYSQLQEQQADLMDKMAAENAAKQKDREKAQNDEQIAIRKEHADALLSIDQDLNGKIQAETQTEQEKIIADTAAFKQKIQAQVSSDGSNQGDIEKEIALADQLAKIRTDKADEADAQEALKLAQANDKVVQSLQERIKLESLDADPKQKFVTGETDKLNDSASAQQIAQTKELAAALYDQQAAEKAAEEATEAHDKAIQKINQELAKSKTSFADAKQSIDEWKDQLLSDLGTGDAETQKYADQVEQIYNQKLKDAYYKSLQDSKDWSDGSIAALHKYSDEATNTSKAADQAFSTAAKGIEDSLTDMVTTGSINLQKLDSVIQSVVQDITRSIIKQSITGPITGSLADLLSGRSDSGGGGGGSLFSSFGSIFSSIFHDGGVVGESGASRRSVPSWLFAGAPRFHDGLSPDEFPAILQRGETVLPKNSPQQAGSSVNVIMNITTPDSNGFRASQAQIAADAARNINRARRNM